MFRPSIHSRIVEGLLLGLGFAFIAVGFGSTSEKGTLFALSGAVPAFLGLYLIFSGSARVFDLKSRLYYKAGKLREWIFRPGQLSLDDIAGLQVLGYEERHSGRTSTAWSDFWHWGGEEAGDYLCFQLNIVRRNNQRVNVVAHANGYRLTRDAQVLAEALGVPLWQGPSKNI